MDIRVEGVLCPRTEDVAGPRVLIVVESEGVRQQIQSATGYPVFATHGHLFRPPRPGESPAFTASGLLIARRPIEERAAVLADLTRTLSEGAWDGLLIGTDPDDEGDVIAADVAHLAAAHAPAATLFRITWQTLDSPSVQRSLKTTQPMARRQNWGAAGLARATIDAMLSSGLPGVGRVMTPLLAALARGGDPRALTLDFHRPWTLRDVLVMDRDRNVEARYNRAESLYLNGRLSYPRTAAQAFWPATCGVMAGAAPLLPGGSVHLRQSLLLPLSAPHEALHATQAAEYAALASVDHDESVPLEQLSANDALLTAVQAAALVSLDLLAADQVVEPPAPSPSPEAWIVDWQFRERLGRPSTWARRATRVATSGWLAPNAPVLNLSPDGHRALARAPDFMRSPDLSRLIEDHIAAEALRGASAEAIVASLQDRLGDLLPEVPQGLRAPAHLVRGETAEAVRDVSCDALVTGRMTPA